MSGIEAIANERRRQVQGEGWSPDHDDDYVSGELAAASACYALNAICPADLAAKQKVEAFIAETWPWPISWWKPSQDPSRDLEKAGALAAADHDRRARAAGGSSSPTGA